jgi:hypothetical protein
VPSWSDDWFAAWSRSPEGEGEMSVNEIKFLREMAESLLTAAEKPPSGPDRNTYRAAPDPQAGAVAFCQPDCFLFLFLIITLQPQIISSSAQ